MVFVMSGKLDLREESFHLFGSLGRRKYAVLAIVLFPISIELPVPAVAVPAIDKNADAVIHGRPPSGFACSFGS